MHPLPAISKEITIDYSRLLKKVIADEVIDMNAAYDLVEAVFKGFENIDLTRLRIIEQQSFINYAQQVKYILPNCRGVQEMKSLEQQQKELTDLMMKTDEKTPEYKMIAEQLTAVLHKQVDYLGISDTPVQSILQFDKALEEFKKTLRRKNRLKRFIVLGVVIIAFGFAVAAEYLMNWGTSFFDWISSWLQWIPATPASLKMIFAFGLGALIMDPVKRKIESWIHKKTLIAQMNSLETEIGRYETIIQNVCETLSIERECLIALMEDYAKKIAVR